LLVLEEEQGELHQEATHAFQVVEHLEVPLEREREKANGHVSGAVHTYWGGSSRYLFKPLRRGCSAASLDQLLGLLQIGESVDSVRQSGEQLQPPPHPLLVLSTNNRAGMMN
jgi:hypothetical protein